MDYPNETVIELHSGGAWVPVATLKALGHEACRIDYLTSHLFSHNPQRVAHSLPLEWDPDAIRESVVGIDPGFDRHPPAFIYDLVPQSLGRKLLVRELGLTDSDGWFCRW